MSKESVEQAREIAGEVVRGERHPLDACNQIVEIWRAAGEPTELQAFAELGDLYEFHLDQPATIKKIIELSEELSAEEFSE